MEKDGLGEVVAQFDAPGKLGDARPWGSGHIHKTYRVALEGNGTPRLFILQKINTNIFKDIDRMMENISRVTGHLRAKLSKLPGRNPDRETLTIVPTRAGEAYWRSAANECWRCYLFIDNARTVDVIETPSQAYEAARAFGAFQQMLSDLPAPPLHDTIPYFHDTTRRVAALEDAIARDSHGRAKACGAEIGFALEMKSIARTVVDGLAQGRLPWRVTHNDTKINNVLLDNATGKGVCVVDLDCVMLGSVLYDFGDEIRSSVGHFAENERDLSRVAVDMEVFEALAAGYLDAADGFLTPTEEELLVFSGMLITYTIGIRFLTDYLMGDVYFQTHRPGENLDRCRTQFELVRSIRRNEGAMRAVVERRSKRG